jgi:RNA polymerase sigma-70 factor (ECF subfamily)
MSSPTPVAAATDRELVERAAGGDERAVALLYDRFGAGLYALAYRITGERADAEEAVVDGFAQAWRAASTFRADRGSVGAWLATIVRSRALDLTRARTRRARLASAAAAEEPGAAPAMGSYRPDPRVDADADERRLRVRAALEALAPAQREAIELAYFEGLSQSEIAERLAEPLGTIKTRIRTGMQKLRDALRPYFHEAAG